MLKLRVGMKPLNSGFESGSMRMRIRIGPWAGLVWGAPFAMRLMPWAGLAHGAHGENPAALKPWLNSKEKQRNLERNLVKNIFL